MKAAFSKLTGRAGPKTEAFGIIALVALAAWFLHLSWRKWPDPIIDSGPQWYDIWRLSQGARPYHDFLWNYGPLSLCFNACLFKCFGPGMMVLVTANLLIYGVIASLAYVAFRAAWGRLGAFAALAVFISVFSFSHLTSVGNYNFATPYTHESTHGLLLLLVAAFIMVRWQREPSRTYAFLFGLCGGLTAVLKPEFMLAGGVLGIAAMALRLVQRKPVRLAESGLIVAGIVLPTLMFTLWLALSESWKSAFIDASQAWWLVLVEKIQSGSVDQQNFSGFDHPWINLWLEAKAASTALVVLAAIWAAGWFTNRSWSPVVKTITVVGAVALMCVSRVDGGWFMAGKCLPGLIVILLVVTLLRVRRELRQSGRLEKNTAMALALVLVAAAMLARMPLRARVNHLGFFQAAFAGMAVAAAMVADLPRWTGTGLWGRRLAAFGSVLVLAVGCCSIAAKSREIRADQTETVGTGRDRFYAFNGEVDETGSLVNWAVEHLRSAPPQATVVVLPEGLMINYLSRHVSPVPALPRGDEPQALLQHLRETPPDYVVLISRDPRQYGPSRYGTLGNPEQPILKWVIENYYLEARQGGDPLVPGSAKGGVAILRHKENSAPIPATPAPVK